MNEYSNNDILKIGNQKIRKRVLLFRWLGIGLLLAGIIGFPLAIFENDGSYKLYELISGGVALIIGGIVLFALSFKKRDPYLFGEKAIKKEIEKREKSKQPNFINANTFLKNSYSDFSGVYIIHNITEDKYYVGQSINVVQRVRNHLTAKGNGDIYADYKYGHSFEVGFVDFNGSGFANLDDMERAYISRYNAYLRGYNKTSGNN